ncbi:MAG TPA: ribosome biogenesis GTPase Der [Candidatus Angelobacter sp.]|nr:ribosome biogenesis GTPase Der [Candidatus Angelobacter sp.]
MSFTVAIVGRPNVGKSTLFNRLVGKRLALTDDLPGVTRDRRSGTASLGDLHFTIIDTAGLEDSDAKSLTGRMRRQTEQAVADADMALFLIDVRAGLTPLDRHFADWLRKQDTPVVLVANKCEGRVAAASLAEAFALGLGEPIPVSAEHGEGLSDLYDAVREQMPAEEGAAAEAAPDGPLQLAIVGRPNVGKSTLINRLVGEDRLLTGPEPGITRDAIAVEWRYRGRPLRLVDTAGMRRRSQVVERLEKLAVEDSLRAVQYAEVVVLVLDAADMLEKQDLAIARQVIEEGRALVIAANKWDAIKDKTDALKLLKDRVAASLTQAQGVALVTLSARTGQNLDKLLDAVFRTHETWNRRLGTPELNRWLATAVDSHPPPLVKGRRIKLRYMTQTKTRPPTFQLFGNQLDVLPEPYLRYLVNSMRERFDLPGVPVRVLLRKGTNPYAGREKKK